MAAPAPSASLGATPLGPSADAAASAPGAGATGAGAAATADGAGAHVPWVWCPCGPPGSIGAAQWCWCPAPRPPERPIHFTEAELPPDDEGPYVPGEGGSSMESYAHMEKAGLIMVLTGLGAAVLGGVLVGAGASSGGSGVAAEATSTILLGGGGVFLGLGGLTVLVGIPLAAIGNSGAP